ncbi:MAG: TetR/AcrR family transcriptional regulator C-terminal domain-containing protein [Acidimicrobiales bacterium]
MPTSEDRPPLSRARVLETALLLIDDAGLEALSMRKLGAALGVEAMSLYNHVASKDDLLAGVADLLLESVEIPAGDEDWRASVRALCNAVRQVGIAHPRAFPLLVTQGRSSLEAWGPVLAGFDLIHHAGLSDEQAVSAVNVVASFLVGFVLFEINAMVHQQPLLHDRDIPPDRALLRRYLAARPLTTDHDAEFTRGLDVLIAGIEAGAIPPV